MAGAPFSFDLSDLSSALLGAAARTAARPPAHCDIIGGDGGGDDGAVAAATTRATIDPRSTEARARVTTVTMRTALAGKRGERSLRATDSLCLLAMVK